MGSVGRAVLKEWETLRIAAKYVTADKLPILYFKHGLIAINKPYGLPVHPGPGVKLSLSDLLPNLKRRLKLTNTPELLNRLDKDCSGVQLLSYNVETARKMSELYARRRIIKEYQTLLVGVPSAMAGKINIPIGQGVVHQKEKIVLRRDLVNAELSECPLDVKFAVTSFEVLDSNKDTCSLVKFTCHTGYKHQIRVHASDALGCPILGDHKYSESYGPQTIPLRLIQLLGIPGVKSETRKRGVIRPWQRALLPLHLLASSVTIPEIYPKPIIINAPMPVYMKESSAKCNLHPKRKKVVMGHVHVYQRDNSMDRHSPISDRLSY